MCSQCSVSVQSFNVSAIVFAVSEPSLYIHHTSLHRFTTWDKLEFVGDLNGEQLSGKLKKEFAATALSLSGEVNYYPPKHLALWKAGDDSREPLSVLFRRLRGGEWPHDYLIINGEFQNKEGEVALLPRIKLAFLSTS